MPWQIDMPRSSLALVLAGTATLLAPGLGHAAGGDTCTAARTMIVLDKSSSMVTGLIGTTPKWDIAVDALDQVVTTYQGSIELGLMVFPHAGECSPGEVDVPPALGMRNQIMNALGDPPPTGGNWTPMAQTLDAAATVPELAPDADGGHPRYVVLITDGWQWCDPYDPATRLTPVDSVMALKALGITTYVVGFGDAVDPIALNGMAVQGGTALSGCDPGGDTPTSPNPCYYRADNPDSLLAALDAIAVQVSAEVCDGADNDCDGTVDNGCECAPGATRGCGEDTGSCAAGVQTCGMDGTWGMCDGDIGPSPETCDGHDNDCDGQTDDDQFGDLCPPGEVCSGGGCHPEDPGNPEQDDGEVSGGCACDAAGARKPSLPRVFFGLSLMIVGGAVLIYRRRRS